jgi:hypothetical protein
VPLKEPPRSIKASCIARASGRARSREIAIDFEIDSVSRGDFEIDASMLDAARAVAG